MGRGNLKPFLKAWKLESFKSYRTIRDMVTYGGYGWSEKHIEAVFNGRRYPGPVLRKRLAELTGIHFLRFVR